MPPSVSSSAGKTNSKPGSSGAAKSVRIHETCGRLSTKWVLSSSSLAGGGGGGAEQHVAHLRDGKPSSSTVAAGLRGFAAMFLPEGYPDSVSSDYTRYQVCDTLQALCSSVTGTLSTRAILKGVGVGEAEATALGGLAQWVLRDGVGMVGRIAFASCIASDLDHDAKRWRLAADLTNDAGLMLEVLSSHLPPQLFLIFVCIANLFKAVTCVAGGATRASLTQHFAVRQNTADVAAKDGSQETAVNLIGMFLGMAVAAYVPDASLLWTLLLFGFFTAMHLVANYLGVKALILDRLNETRLLICLERMAAAASSSSSSSSPPMPLEMRDLEPVVFPHPKPVRVEVGASLRACLSNAATGFDASSPQAVVARLDAERFLAVPRRDGSVGVVLAEGAESDPDLLLTAYLGALSAKAAQGCGACRRLMAAAGSWPELKGKLVAAGWRTDRVQLRVRDHRVKVAE